MDVQSAVHLRQVESPQYSSQINRPEVLEVIDEIKKQVRLDPTKSILVATMNTKQAAEIEMAWEVELQSSPELEDYVKNMSSSLDELVIKNLENIQGDERDVVIISTVYGPDSNGRVYQRFGDLVNKQGWRWLNVLLTRAKHRVVLVTSLYPSDIDIKETTSLGVRALKNYLIYAKTGQIDTSMRQPSGEADSPFEEAVRDALLSLGHEVTLQVGVAGYRIDMAVINPKDPSTYLLAIECDGATYHSSYSARSRDRLRQQVLESLGWKVYRIWSTDWFRDPHSELQRLDKFIRSLS